MPKLKVVTAKKLLKWLHKRGVYQVRQKGSHVFVASDDRSVTSVVPVHAGDLPRGTLRTILKDLEISVQKYEKSI